MNVLLFVMTLLMVMSLMTYARLESFRAFFGVKTEFESFIKDTERGFYNVRNIKWYNDTHVSKKGKENKEKEDATKSSSRMSFFPLIDKNSKDAEWEKFAPTRLLATRLIKVLYQDTPFMQEIAKQQPLDNFIDELLLRMHKTAIALPDDQKIKSPADLANLDLGDYTYNDIFYRILKGTREPDPSKAALEKAKNTSDEDIEDNEISDGYDSLLDYITVKNKTKIRVWLASKPLLTAIVTNPDAVPAILELRNRLYDQIKKDMTKPSEAGKQFEALFKSMTSTAIDDNILDFSASKTNPKPYE